MTPEQQAAADEYVEKWTKLALRTTPIDRSKLRGVTDFIYESYKLSAPPDSEIHVLPSIKEAWKYICRRECKTEEEYQEKSKSIVFPVVDGVFDSMYLAFLDYSQGYLGEELKPSDAQYLKHMPEINFVWALDDYVVYSEFPERYCYNENYEQHCEDGPALSHNGEHLWYINGIEVDEQIVMRPETQTIEQIVGERNNDVQEIRIERFGWLPFLEGIGATVLDERPNDIEGTWEALYDTEFGRKFVATCVSGKIPVLSVPPSISTCEEAAKWLLGDDDTIRVIART